MANKFENGPLTEAVYYILISLHKPLHGYGIIQQVEKMSNGRLILAAGTLYGALTSLLNKGWICALEEEENSRKKEYRITAEGKSILQAEITRLKELLENSKYIEENL